MASPSIWIQSKSLDNPQRGLPSSASNENTATSPISSHSSTSNRPIGTPVYNLPPISPSAGMRDSATASHRTRVKPILLPKPPTLPKYHPTPTAPSSTKLPLSSNRPDSIKDDITTPHIFACRAQSASIFSNVLHYPVPNQNLSPPFSSNNTFEESQSSNRRFQMSPTDIPLDDDYLHAYSSYLPVFINSTHSVLPKSSNKGASANAMSTLDHKPSFAKPSSQSSVYSSTLSVWDTPIHRGLIKSNTAILLDEYDFDSLSSANGSHYESMWSVSSEVRAKTVNALLTSSNEFKPHNITTTSSIPTNVNLIYPPPAEYDSGSGSIMSIGCDASTGPRRTIGCLPESDNLPSAIPVPTYETILEVYPPPEEYDTQPVVVESSDDSELASCSTSPETEPIREEKSSLLAKKPPEKALRPNATAVNITFYYPFGSKPALHLIPHSAMEFKNLRSCKFQNDISNADDYRIDVDSHSVDNQLQDLESGISFTSENEIIDEDSSSLLSEGTYNTNAEEEYVLKDVLNILLLGESGVGKSTFISGISNYLQYSSLDEAEKNGLIAHIPIRYQYTDPITMRSQEIFTGFDENENHEIGESCTKSPRTYEIPFNGMSVRLIDTPGVGDTRGYDHDKRNFQNILKHLENIDVLHGILILLNSSNSKLNVMFRFCIKELLTIIHKNASVNIVFCFTHSQVTHFKPPGDVIEPLRKLLEDNGVDIELNRNTIYLFDNDPVRYLASILSATTFEPSEEEQRSFGISWKKSSDETWRLFDHTKTCRPHLVKDMLLVNATRQMIVNLSQPLADITKVIQNYLAEIKLFSEEIQKKKSEANGYKQILSIPDIETDFEYLDSTHKVCYSKTCLKFVRDGDIEETQYACLQKHKPTYFKVKSAHSICDKCGCPSGTHKKVKYLIKEVKKYDAEARQLKEDLDKEILTDNQRRALLVNIRKEYVTEQQKITKISAEFRCFLKTNGISSYNDTMKEYLDYYLQAHQGQDPAMTANLEDIRKNYDKEINKLEALMTKSQNQSKHISARHIQKQIDSLYAMKHVGPMLKALADHVNSSIPNEPAAQRRNGGRHVESFLKRH